MIVHDCEQGGEEWMQVRMGKPTASEFAAVMATGRDSPESKTRAKYLRQLAGEIITEIPREDFKNEYMARGNEMEAEARSLYAMMANADVSQVGFIENWRCGASPDGLIGSNGMLEIKTAAPHILIDRLLSGDLPPAHKAQLQGNLWIAEREWIDLAIFYRKMPLYRRRVKRDESFIARLKLATAVFLEDLDALVAKIRAYSA